MVLHQEPLQAQVQTEVLEVAAQVAQVEQALEVQGIHLQLHRAKATMAVQVLDQDRDLALAVVEVLI